MLKRCRSNFLYFGLFIFLGLFAAAKVFSPASDGRDFVAYHLAGDRIAEGFSPYVASDRLPYKYAPPSFLMAWFFGVLPFDVGRAILVLLYVISLWGIAEFIFSVAKVRDPKLKVQFLIFALIPTLRFLDNEFFSAQINVLMYGGIFWAWSFLLKSQKSFKAWPIFGFFASWKLHPFLWLMGWTSRRSLKSLWVGSLSILGSFLILWPHRWLDLKSHLATTNQEFPLEGHSKILQGFFPFLDNYWSIKSSHPLAWLFALVIVFVAIWVSHQKARNLGELDPRCFLANSLGWLVLGVSFSPLPWQHTYTVLFPVFLFWCTQNSNSKLLWALIAFFALTPSGIIGAKAAQILEQWQLIYVATLICVWQLFYWGRNQLDPPSKTH